LPAPAVIPAPLVYISIVVIKTLVVEMVLILLFPWKRFRGEGEMVLSEGFFSFSEGENSFFTLSKLDCLKDVFFCRTIVFC